MILKNAESVEGTVKKFQPDKGKQYFAIEYFDSVGSCSIR